jgi:glycosyltransferase involved in cell wall biosynthesis
MKIAFIHNDLAFLPELSAYQLFFQKQNIESCLVKYGEEENSGADVYWYMMGLYPKARYRKKLIIHEYSSASVPPYRKLKDWLKRRFNPRPDFRLFQSEYVRNQIHIYDEVPCGYRDMGVNEDFFYPMPETEKEFDFIYSGSLSAERNLTDLLGVFDQGALRECSIVLLGKDNEELKNKFSHRKNIIFQGSVPWTEVAGWLARSRYAVNFIPDREPFNAQTPTKFLEYAAMKVPIISTNYFWISEFQERYGGNYFLLKDDLSNMTWDRINLFSYEFPKLESWKWDEKIRASGVLDFLRQSKIH